MLLGAELQPRGKRRSALICPGVEMQESGVEILQATQLQAKKIENVSFDYNWTLKKMLFNQVDAGRQHEACSWAEGYTKLIKPHYCFVLNFMPFCGYNLYDILCLTVSSRNSMGTKLDSNLFSKN